ncbi:hypothetical protein SUGI_0942200 [Cryptomeria japonica]|uniref:F-box only protein 6 n=1 Tax=Cryptomeria japonica TaxID=3369 RepID=UPI002414ABD4|nr:F-box only protein 6 [Cryptomeria japonica]GLJ44794.1 hypothetical protein SUGI_0942200 [Cryptomeria japonica]
MELQSCIAIRSGPGLAKNINIEFQHKNSVKMDLKLEFQGSSLGPSLDSSVWGELPEDLTLNLLAHLPLQSLVRFHTVSKKWSSMLSSPYFMSLWNDARWHQPWLLMCTPKPEIPCLMYSFATNTWQNLSLSFLPEAKYGINCNGSARGLLLVEVPNFSFSLNSASLYVCNPLTKSCTEIPIDTSITAVMAKGMTESENGGYSVLALGKTRENLCVVEVYESSKKSWRIAGSLPDEFCIKNQDMVFSGGFLFCLTVKPCGVLVFDIQHGFCSIVAMPVHGDVVKGVRPKIVACGSKVFLVEGIEKEYTVKSIIISEIQMDGNLTSTEATMRTAAATTTSTWKETARMPEVLLMDFFKTSCSIWFECVGVGDCLCFRAHGSVGVVVYNVKKSTWTWLPKCDNRYKDHKHMFMRSLAFQP